MSWLTSLLKLVPLVKPVVKVVRELTRKEVKGVGTHYHAAYHRHELQQLGTTDVAAPVYLRRDYCAFCGLTAAEPDYAKPCRPSGSLRT